MTDQKVIPFRKRPPSEAELEMYRQITRNWHPEMRRLMLPEHFKRDQPARKASEVSPHRAAAPLPPGCWSHQRPARRQFWCALAVVIFSIASPTVKLAALARGGNSLKVSSTLPTIACAGTNRNIRWATQSP